MRFLLQVLIALLLPIFLVLTNVRVLMTSSFARWEYAKPNFPDPADVVQSNLSQASASGEAHIVPVGERQRIVDTTLAYVKGAGDDSLIADMESGEGWRVYNAREVRHLRDVRVLVGQVTIVHIVSGLIILLGAGYLIWTGRSQAAAAALTVGSVLTVGFIGVIGVIAALMFQFFFVRFHRIFFEGETWLFPSTDTLIQVFPEKFWFDASLLIVLLALVEAAVIGVVALGWLGVRRWRDRRQPAQAT